MSMPARTGSAGRVGSVRAAHPTASARVWRSTRNPTLACLPRVDVLLRARYLPPLTTRPCPRDSEVERRPIAVSRKSGALVRRRQTCPAFEVEEVALAVEAAAVAGEVARGADDAVTGHDHADRVAAVGETYGAGGGRLAQRCGDLPVGGRLSVGDLLEQRPHPLLEGRPVEDQRQIEFGQLPGEVGGELFH